MEDSLQYLLSKFPYFFNKDAASNFYKSQSVTNAQFQGVYQSLFDVVESFKLDKNCLIWKEQSKPYEYTINFVANYPYLKSVKCYKNDEVIYSEEYELGDSINSFEFSYSNNTLNEFKTLFYDNATASNHRDDWILNNDLIVEYDNDGTIISEENYVSSSYFANFEAIDDTIIEFDIQSLNAAMNGVRFYYKQADIHLQPYLTDLKKHHIRLECKNNLIRLFVDELEKETKEIVNSNNSCRFIINKSSVRFNDFYINTNLEDIIPQHQFKIIVETFEEYLVSKGWPENDNMQNNEFDHDESLDEIGALHNIPRKEYLIVGEELYAATEPPYNDRASEDDYHYMKRILEYMLRYHTTPLPVLEIWKLYGIDATLENREKLLLKVFDLEKHPNFIDNRTDSQGNYISDGDRWFSGTQNEDGTITEWTPKKWEHLDKFCDYSSNLGKYFFVKASTKIPVKNQNVIFYFKFLDGFAHDLDEECSVDILLNNTMIYEDITDSQITIRNNEIPQDQDNTFTFIAKDSTGEIINTQEVVIVVRGCNSGNFYVNPTTGSDSNDGKTRITPFKTIQKAVNSVHGDEKLIILLSGDYEITSPVIINKDCVIMGCGSVLIENTSKDLFFRVYPSVSLTLQDMTLQYKGDVCNVSNHEFVNNNGTGEIADVLILFTNAPVLIMTFLEVDFVASNYAIGDTVQFTGSLKDRFGNPITDETVVVEGNNTTISSTTNSNGVYNGSLTAERMGDLTLNASYSGDSTYKSSVATATINIKLRLTDLLSSYDYVVMDLEYDEETTDWDYLTKPVSEITKFSDLDGAILNLQFSTDKEVQFERFTSYSDESYLTKNDMQKLRGLLVGIVYDDEYNVKYTNAHLFGESKLTITTQSTSFLVGDTITFSGTLLDEYDDPIVNKAVVVNNQTCVTNENGVYTGSVTATNVGNFYLRAKFEGDYDFDESSASKTLSVRISLATVLSDYDYVVMDLEYDEETRDWKYNKKAVGNITSLSDINNSVKNLTKINDEIIFERFTSTSTNTTIGKTELQSLNGLLVGIVYDDYKIRYTKI